MRFLTLFALLAAAGTARADDEPIIRVGVRVASGVNLDGSGGNRVRLVPVSAGVGGEFAFQTQPWTSVTGEIFAEGPDVLSVGLAGGLRVHVAGGALRLGAGGTVIVTPDTKVGANASVGGCFLHEIPAMCFDVTGTLFFAGEGLADQPAAAQVKLVMDVGFDVL
jgi:hypothetical protein